MWGAWINDHKDTCPGCISFPVAQETFFFASLYPAHCLLLYLSRTGDVQVSHYPPWVAPEKQWKSSSWSQLLEDSSGLFSHPAVNLDISSDLGHTLIPVRTSCLSYVRQSVLESNNTRSSSITPSFLPQARSSLLSQALSPYTCLRCSGVQSGAFKSLDITWSAGLEEQSAPSGAAPQTTRSHILMAVGKRKG